jgi:heterodisulfide reductase subunit A-like polyferredoxin
MRQIAQMRDACPAGAINFEQKDEMVEFKVGA